MLDPLSSVDFLSSTYGLTTHDCALVHKSQNLTFRAHLSDGEAFVRVTEARRRTLEQIESELDFAERAAAAGIRTPRTRQTLSGRRVALMSGDVPRYVVVFDRASGRPVASSDLAAPLFEAIGRLTAQLHCVGTTSCSETERWAWWQSALITSDLDALPKDQTSVRLRTNELIQQLRREWSDASCLLIHGDIHFQNLFVDESDLAIFDFDNCERGTEGVEFATILYDCAYNRLRAHIPDAFTVARATSFAASLWNHFCRGYSSVRELPPITAGILDLCLRLRETVRYTHYHRLVDVNSMPESFQTGLAELRVRIEEGAPPLDVRTVLGG